MWNKYVYVGFLLRRKGLDDAVGLRSPGYGLDEGHESHMNWNPARIEGRYSAIMWFMSCSIKNPAK